VITKRHTVWAQLDITPLLRLAGAVITAKNLSLRIAFTFVSVNL
jgi:hypothetical protein